MRFSSQIIRYIQPQLVHISLLSHSDTIFNGASSRHRVSTIAIALRPNDEDGLFISFFLGKRAMDLRKVRRVSWITRDFLEKIH